MILVIGQFRLPPENVAAAREPMARVIAATRAEDGCLAYAYAQDVLEPGLFRISERWESRAHLDAHLAAPHMKTWAEERAALGLHDRQLAIVTVGVEEVL
ncbi:MAG: hypothetical protein RIQ46_1605 [Pseudomonadota bacterium]